MQEQKDV